MQLDSLVGLQLIYAFLQAINADFEWSENKDAIKIVGGDEFFSKKSIMVSNYDALASFLNVTLLLERYAIEVSIKYDQEANVKTFKCSRINNTGTTFESKHLLEAILRVVVEWRYGGDADCVEKLQTKVQSDRAIPLDSLGLSFPLLLSLRKRKINNVSDLNGFSSNDIADILGGNSNLLNELKQKLNSVGVDLS